VGELVVGFAVKKSNGARQGVSVCTWKKRGWVLSEREAIVTWRSLCGFLLVIKPGARAGVHVPLESVEGSGGERIATGEELFVWCLFCRSSFIHGLN